MAKGDSISLQVKNAVGVTKNLAALDGTGSFEAGNLVPVHYIAGVSGSYGDALTLLSGSILTADSGQKLVRVTGSFNLDNTSIDVQTTPESAVVASSSVSPASLTAAVIGDGDTNFSLAKTLTITIANRTSDVVYIKLHSSASAAPTTYLASNTDYSYVLDSYSTYEAQSANARLWHSYTSVDTLGKVAVTYTRTNQF